MDDQTGTQAPAQAVSEDFGGIFQERLRGIVREGLLSMFEREVAALCGETYRPTESVYRRAGSEGGIFLSVKTLESQRAG